MKKKSHLRFSGQKLFLDKKGLLFIVIPNFFRTKPKSEMTIHCQNIESTLYQRRDLSTYFVFCNFFLLCHYATQGNSMRTETQRSNFYKFIIRLIYVSFSTHMSYSFTVSPYRISFEIRHYMLSLKKQLCYQLLDISKRCRCA